MDTTNLPRLNGAQATFVKAIAAGATLVDARRQAYPRTLSWPANAQWANASRTAASRKVGVWINAINGTIMGDLKITRKSLLEKLEAIATNAAADRQYGAAVSATKEQGVLAGLRVEGKREDDDLAPDRLRAKLAAVEKELAQYQGKAHLRVASGAGKGKKSA